MHMNAVQLYSENLPVYIMRMASTVNHSTSDSLEIITALQSDALISVQSAKSWILDGGHFWWILDVQHKGTHFASRCFAIKTLLQVSIICQLKYAPKSIWTPNNDHCIPLLGAKQLKYKHVGWNIATAHECEKFGYHFQVNKPSLNN